MRAAILSLALAAALIADFRFAPAAPTDDEVKQLTIASYPGNCPCPYRRAANGSKCGNRSAWSKAGEYAPICYPEEVTPVLIEQFRKSRNM